VCNSTPHFAADNRLVNACNQASAPVVCRCMDQSISQSLGILGLSITCFPPKLPLSLRDRHPHVTRCSLGRANSSSQTASRSVQPFWYESQMLCWTTHCQWGRKLPKLSLPLGFRRLPEEDRATAIGNMHRKLVKIARVVPEMSSRTDKHKHRHAHHNTSQLLPRAK